MCAIKVLGQKTALDFIICSAERIVTGLFHRDFISGDYNYENAGRYCANQIAPEKWPDIRVCAYSESNSKMLSRYVFLLIETRIELLRKQIQDGLRSLLLGVAINLD